MNKIKVETFTGGKNLVQYTKGESEYTVSWGETNFEVSYAAFNDILNNLLVRSDTWYPLGASMTKPTHGGLGEYISNNIKNLTPRHASAIAPIMENEGFLEHRIKGSAILLKKITDKIWVWWGGNMKVKVKNFLISGIVISELKIKRISILWLQRAANKWIKWKGYCWN